MLRLKVNRKHDFVIEKSGNDFAVNGVDKAFDIQQIDEKTFHIIHENKSFNASILSYDFQNKTLEIKVNGRTHFMEFQDDNDLLLEKMGIKKTDTKLSNELKAPMPGLIVDIKVTEGQEVKSGDPLIILKAMKMENILKSPHDALIKRILVDTNQKIEKDAIIIQF